MPPYTKSTTPLKLKLYLRNLSTFSEKIKILAARQVKILIVVTWQVSEFRKHSEKEAFLSVQNNLNSTFWEV
jgi:hypothetical protein